MRKIKPILEISLEFQLPIRLVEIDFPTVLNLSGNAASLTYSSRIATIGSKDYGSESIPAKKVILQRSRSNFRRDRMADSFHQTKQSMCIDSELRCNEKRNSFSGFGGDENCRNRTGERARLIHRSLHSFDRRNREGFLVSSSKRGRFICLGFDFFCFFF